MKIAIVGTRPAPTLHSVQVAEWFCISDDVYDFVRSLGEGHAVVSGGASGVDTVAADGARCMRLPLTVHRADWNRHGKAAGMIRNGLIVADADEIHAWPSSWSRGTWDTIRKAQAAGKPCIVHEPWKVKS